MVDYERDFKLTKCDEHYRDWSRLPADILRDISSRLFFVDYDSFANVCTSWRSAKTPLSSQMPWVFLHKNHFSPKPLCKLLNITNNLSNTVRMPILGGKVSIGSQDGWLILVDSTVHVISLYNPFSQQEIKLLSHAHIVTWLISNAAVSLAEHEIVSNSFSIRKVVLSSAPNSTTPFPAAAALLDNQYLMYKQDGECGWKLLSSYAFADITCWRGKFVGVTWEGDVYKLDLDMDEPKLECIGRGILYHAPPTYYKRLVSLNDSLLLVWWLSNDPETRRSLVFNIIKLDIQQLDWIPIDDLCGHSLFLGTSNSFSLSAHHIPGLQDNLIYSIQDLWGYDPGIDITNWKRDIGVFNIRKGTYEICPLPNTLLPRSTSSFWYVPHLLELQKEMHSCNEAGSD